MEETNNTTSNSNTTNSISTNTAAASNNTTHNSNSTNTVGSVVSNIEPILPLATSTAMTMNYDTTIEPHFDGRMVENSDKGQTYDPSSPPSTIPNILSENAVQGTRTHRYIYIHTYMHSSI